MSVRLLPVEGCDCTEVFKGCVCANPVCDKEHPMVKDADKQSHSEPDLDCGVPICPICGPRREWRKQEAVKLPGQSIGESIRETLEEVDQLAAIGCTCGDFEVCDQCQGPAVPRGPQNVLRSLPQDAGERKDTPIGSGVIDYFPAALAEVARLSKAGNDQHNPGQPLHWARGKSADHWDCIIRHGVERGTRDADGMRHSAKLAWRALALLQEEIEAEAGFVPAPD